MSSDNSLSVYKNSDYYCVLLVDSFLYSVSCYFFYILILHIFIIYTRAQQIAYTKNDLIYVINIDGSNEQPISTPPGNPDWDEDGDPNWSPDGKKIIFDRDFDSLWIVNPDGSGAYDLTPSMPDAMGPDWQRLPVLEPAIGGELDPSNLLTIGSQLIAAISTIALTIGMALKKKKLG
jgi:hypothetical protein